MHAVASCVLVCCAFASLLGQQLSYYQHDQWSTNAGLPQSSVHQILQSRDGYLWLATESGVVRYDGVVFKVFQHATDPSFTSDDVSSIAEDRSGDMWFGTMDGLIERTGRESRRFTEADGLPAASILALHAGPDGSMLITTAAGQVSYNGTVFRAAGRTDTDLDTSLHGSANSANGTHWSWDAKSVTAHSHTVVHTWRLTKELPGTRIQAVIVDPSGDAWVGTNQGLFRLAATDQRVAPVPELHGESILAIIRDTEGDLWIGTETSGLHALRPRAFRTEPALANEEVSCIAQASDGSLWIGTREEGVQHLRIDTSGSAKLEKIPNAELTSPVILSIAAGNHDDVWVGTPDGLNYIDSGNHVTRYTSADGLPDDLVRSLLIARDGTLWVGTRGGLAHFAEGHFKIFTDENGLGGNLIGPLLENASGAPTQAPVLWVATLTGVSRIQNGIIKNYSSAEGLQSNLITGFAIDRTGHLWISSRDSGLFLYCNDRFVKIAAKNIPDDLEGVLSDQRGGLWLRSKQSVLRSSTDALAKCVEHTSCETHLSTYDQADGMGNEEIVSQGNPTAIRTSDDSLWFATRNGVSITDPATLPHNTVAPPVVIEKYTVDSDDMATGPGLHVIPSGHNRYTFEFAALSFVAPSKVVYRFKLDGFDHNWSNPDPRRSATYTNLPAGTYTFRVIAANNDGVWNQTGATVLFRISPPLYRRWWSLLMAAILVVGLIVMFYRLRVRRLQRDFNTILTERNRIAREIHDTLAQDFIGVSLQLDLITHFLAQPNIEGAREQVLEARGFVQKGIEEARQSIWNLRSNTASDSLPARVNALAARFTRGSLTVETRLGGAYRVLPSRLEQELLRILQEALTNVERHSSATLAHIRIAYGKDTLVMILDDNGCGFSMAEAEAMQGHFGLLGMRERAASINATLEITSAANEGTTLKLIVPIEAVHENQA